MTCWSCSSPVDATAFNCPKCGRLQPPRTNDYFAYLGMPRTYHIDADTLSDLMHERSRKLHPDRFARAEPRERTLSLQHTTLLNDAVRTLRDPQRRAEYLLGLHGLKAGGNDRAGAKMDPSFLMEMLDVREELDAAKTGRDVKTLIRIAKGAEAARDALEEEADQLFTAWEKKPADHAPLKTVVGVLDKMRYFEQLLAEASFQTNHH